MNERNVCLLAIFVISVIHVRVSGQGGTGRGTTSPSPAKKVTSAKPKVVPKTRRMKPPTTTSDVPTGPTLKNTIATDANGAPLKMEFVWVPPGSFIMGSEQGELNEKPAHRVTFLVNEEASAMARYELSTAEEAVRSSRRELDRLKSLRARSMVSQTEYDLAEAQYATAKTKRDSLRTTTGEYGFYLGKFEVTQTQWQAVMGNNPSDFKQCGGDCPVESVSWIEVQQFLDKLNDLNDGYLYRLPTEAEWEYASRSGISADSLTNVKQIGWVEENSRGQPHPVGRKRLSPWGLADMLGNVWEWCLDSYHATYDGAPNNGSAWMVGGEPKQRVIRGSSMFNRAIDSRFARRAFSAETNRDRFVGFRVVAVPLHP